MPTPEQIAKVEANAGKTIKKIEDAVHTEKPEKPASAAADSEDTVRATEKASRAVAGLTKSAKAAAVGGLVQHDKEAAASVGKMKGMVNDQLTNSGIDVHNAEVQREIQAELKKQTEEFLKPNPITKVEKYNRVEAKKYPEIFDQLHELTEKHKARIGRGSASVMNPDVEVTYETSHDKAGERLTTADQGSLQVPNSVAQTQNRACQSGEDEVFDNCVKAAAVEDAEEVADSKAMNPSQEEEGSRAYGTAAVDFLSKVDQELGGQGQSTS